MQTGHVVGSCQGFLECDNGCNLFAPVRRPAARERSRTAGKTELTSDYCTLHPHARAAAAPSGRSFFWWTVLSRQWLVREEKAGPMRVSSEGLALALSCRIRSAVGAAAPPGRKMGPVFRQADRFKGREKPLEMKKGAGASPLFRN